MSDTLQTAVDTVHDVDTTEAAEATEPELVLQDALVEDVSIDGMCGVY